MTPSSILVLGHSDGIGQEIACQLLAAGHRVVGISRRASGLEGDRFEEHRVDASTPMYAEVLHDVVAGHAFDVAIHCIAVGGAVDPQDPDLAEQTRTLDTNFRSMVSALDLLVRDWRARGIRGHFLGLSSLADVLAIRDAPMYSGSKAGISSFLRGAALLLRPHGIAVTNVRFGFVDTKLASAPVKPFQLTREVAARRVIRCLRTRPLQYSTPKAMTLLVQLLSAAQNVQAWFARA